MHGCIHTYIHTYIHRTMHTCVYGCNIYVIYKVRGNYNLHTFTLQIVVPHIFIYLWTNMVSTLKIYVLLQCYFSLCIQVHAYIYRYSHMCLPTYIHTHMHNSKSSGLIISELPYFQRDWIPRFPKLWIFGNPGMTEICIFENPRNLEILKMCIYVCIFM